MSVRIMKSVFECICYEQLCLLTGCCLASFVHIVTSLLFDALKAVAAVSMSTSRGLQFSLTLNMSPSQSSHPLNR